MADIHELVDVNANPLNKPITKLLVKVPILIGEKTKWDREKRIAAINTHLLLLKKT